MREKLEGMVDLVRKNEDRAIEKQKHSMIGMIGMIWKGNLKCWLWYRFYYPQILANC